jgi:hypothetical protein
MRKQDDRFKCTMNESRVVSDDNAEMTKASILFVDVAFRGTNSRSLWKRVEFSRKLVFSSTAGRSLKMGKNYLVRKEFY